MNSVIEYKYNTKGDLTMDNFDLDLFLEYLKDFFNEVIEWLKTL